MAKLLWFSRVFDPECDFCFVCVRECVRGARVPGDHMRSDWHRHNLKRHLRNIGPITEEGFESLTAAERAAIEQAEGNYQ